MPPHVCLAVSNPSDTENAVGSAVLLTIPNKLFAPNAEQKLVVPFLTTLLTRKQYKRYERMLNGLRGLFSRGCSILHFETYGFMSSIYGRPESFTSSAGLQHCYGDSGEHMDVSKQQISLVPL
jgi:hypothetical protein